MTRSIDAPPVKVGTAEVVLEAVVVEAGAVEVEVTVDVTIVEEAEEVEEVAVGVVKVETIPLPLTGYYQQSLSTRKYLQHNIGARWHGGSGGSREAVHLVGAGSSVVAAVSSISSERNSSLSAAVGAPWTSDIIACDRGRWQEVDGAVHGGDSADIAVLIPDETVLVKGHSEIGTLGENHLLSTQRPCLQVDVNCGTRTSAKTAMDEYL
jgi:hypothetical protein